MSARKNCVGAVLDGLRKTSKSGFGNVAVVRSSVSITVRLAFIGRLVLIAIRRQRNQSWAQSAHLIGSGLRGQDFKMRVAVEIGCVDRDSTGPYRIILRWREAGIA